jgi:inhibitor of KinA sporulation pathway (predicted exonuclease)
MSRRKLDKIIFIDLEATCWASVEEQGDQVSEIIEIGACMLDLKTGLPERKKSYLIRPRHSTISNFCTELTSITPELIKSQGIPFGDAVNKLKKDFGPTTRTWASWGYYDKAEIERECVRHNIPYPMGRNHINAKNLYALKHGLSNELGMIAALQHAGIPHEGTHHRGDDDAWNCAKLLWTVLGR